MIFLFCLFFFFYFDISMRCIVIPLHMTAISWDFAMEDKVINIQSWYFLYETHFICISRRQIIKKRMEWQAVFSRISFYYRYLGPSDATLLPKSYVINQSNKQQQQREDKCIPLSYFPLFCGIMVIFGLRLGGLMNQRWDQACKFWIPKRPFFRECALEFKRNSLNVVEVSSCLLIEE